MTVEETTRSEHPGSERTRWLLPAAIRTALVAAGFSLVVCCVLAAVWIQSTAGDPLDSPRLRSLQEALRKQPNDEQIKQRIRQLDLQLRHEYFRRMGVVTTGAYLLAGGLGVFLIAGKFAMSLRKNPPYPVNEERDETRRTQKLGRWATGFTGIAVACAALLAAILPPPPVPRAPPGKFAAAYAPPTSQQIAANWPRFRGPAGAGISAYENIPTSWDGLTGREIAWKTPVPLHGHGSPVVWGDRVFLTGADKHRREVYCFDTETGKLLWTHTVENLPGTGIPEVSEETGFAASTGTTDGRRFFAVFANGEVVCVDFRGRRLWRRNLGIPESIYGYASSPAMHRGRVLVLYDQGQAEDDRSFLYALETADGRTAWKATRPVGASWASPIVIHTAQGDQVVTLATPWVISHDAISGEIIWKVSGIGSDVAPSPIFAGGLVFAISPNYTLFAIHPDGRGDVTATHVLWTVDENVPDICSPVSDGELVFLMTSGGLLSCFEVPTGRKLWEHDFEMEFRSSPSLAANRLYVLSGEGVMYILAGERQFRLFGRAILGEPSTCSPAFTDGRIYIRGSENLYCIAGEVK